MNASEAKRDPSYTKRPKDLVSAEECAVMIQARIQAYHEQSIRARKKRLLAEGIVVLLILVAAWWR